MTMPRAHDWRPASKYLRFGPGHGKDGSFVSWLQVERSISAGLRRGCKNVPRLVAEPEAVCLPRLLKFPARGEESDITRTTRLG